MIYSIFFGPLPGLRKSQEPFPDFYPILPQAEYAIPPRQGDGVKPGHIPPGGWDPGFYPGM